MADSIEARARELARLQWLTILERVVDVLKLGLMIAVLVVALVLGSKFAGFSDQQDRIECIARQLGKPWIGLRESFNAPPGDAAARARALEAIDRGIQAIADVDKTCRP